jgi:hypothetical protein
VIRELLVPVHRHALAVPAKLAVGRGRDGTRRVALVRALLESKQLLGAERLVVDLCGRLNQVLQVGTGEEVAEVDEFAVVLVLDWRVLVQLARNSDLGGLPLMMPHLFWRPRTFLPLTTTVLSEPTTAKGRSSCKD